MEKGHKGNEWIQSVCEKIGGKGDGKSESAQASGQNINCLAEVTRIAEEFVRLKLGNSPTEGLVYRAGSVVSTVCLIIVEYSSEPLTVTEGSTLLLNYKGTILSQPAPIIFALAPANMNGNNDPFTEASILQWLEFADTLFTAVHPLTYKSSHNKNMPDLLIYLKYLNEYLYKFTFLVQDRISIADLYVFCLIQPVSEIIFNTEIQNSNFINVKRWFDTIKGQPSVQKVLKRLHL